MTPRTRSRLALRSERGLSLVEVTIMLIVLSTLTAVVAPAASSYIEGARNTKAKEDTEAIGSALELLLRDTGMPCVSKSPGTFTDAWTIGGGATTAPCSLTNRVELLVSGSAINTDEPTVAANMGFTASASIASAANLNWAGGSNEVGDATKDTIDRHLVTNFASGYPLPTFTAGGGPRARLGWRGAYLNGPIDTDPWGYVYQANTIFFATANNATNNTGSGEIRGGWTSDVLVVSAGSNGVLQTLFGGTTATGGLSTSGDDIVYVVQGGTH
jgi:type II secretory pathway pseudopilin PulG